MLAAGGYVREELLRLEPSVLGLLSAPSAIGKVLASFDPVGCHLPWVSDVICLIRLHGSIRTLSLSLQLLAEIDNGARWIDRHVSDYSAIHHRQLLVGTLLPRFLEKIGATESDDALTVAQWLRLQHPELCDELHMDGRRLLVVVFALELRRNAEFVLNFPGHESLWRYRFFLLHNLLHNLAGSEDGNDLALTAPFDLSRLVSLTERWKKTEEESEGSQSIESPSYSARHKDGKRIEETTEQLQVAHVKLVSTAATQGRTKDWIIDLVVLDATLCELCRSDSDVSHYPAQFKQSVNYAVRASEEVRQKVSFKVFISPLTLSSPLNFRDSYLSNFTCSSFAI